MPDYIVAEPVTGRPTINRVFVDYDVAKYATRQNEVVTNAKFVSRKGHNIPSKVSRIGWPISRPLIRKVLNRIPRVA